MECNWTGFFHTALVYRIFYMFATIMLMYIEYFHYLWCFFPTIFSILYNILFISNVCALVLVLFIPYFLLPPPRSLLLLIIFSYSLHNTSFAPQPKYACYVFSLYPAHNLYTELSNIANRNTRRKHITQVSEML